MPGLSDKPIPKAFGDDEPEEVRLCSSKLICPPFATIAARQCFFYAIQVPVVQKKVEKEKPRQIDLMLEKLKQYVGMVDATPANSRAQRCFFA
jgi:hypothetical protein